MITTPYLRKRLIFYPNNKIYSFLNYILRKIPYNSFFSKYFHSYKVRCESCHELLELTTEFRSNFKWEVKKDYYCKDKYLKTFPPDSRGYVGYYVAKEHIKNDKILCVECFFHPILNK